MWRQKQAIYETWAPEAARWSPWVKPVLFATFDEESRPLAPAGAADVSWAPPARRAPEPAEASGYREGDAPGPGAPGSTALVLELPGQRSLELALALAAVGYRPVPVISATPPPRGTVALVDARPMQGLLGAGADTLRTLSLPADAPPAFALDSDRLPERRASPGQYDNRSLVFPQDFPSAAHLREANIAEVLVVSRAPTVRSDLAHVLARYKEGGLRVELSAPDAGAPRQPIATTPLSDFRGMMYRAFALVGMARNAAGGFGSLVPVPSSGGG